MDYDGEGIALRKSTNLKKSAQILKTAYKFKNPPEQIKSQKIQNKKFEKLKIRPATNRD